MCLPDVANLSGDLDKDIEILESIFNSFADHLSFHGMRVSVKHTPTYNIGGRKVKESLWHLISEEKYFHGTRHYLAARAKTITWFETVLNDAYEHCDKIMCWWAKDIKSNRKGPVDRLHIYFVKECGTGEYTRYLIVLEDRRRYYQLVSAYPVTKTHKINTLEESMKNATRVYTVHKKCSC